MPMAFSMPKPDRDDPGDHGQDRTRTMNVSDSDAATFWPSTVSRRNESRNVPVWIAVEIRLPKVPKMLPRSPMAAGTITSRPG